MIAVEYEEVSRQLPGTVQAYNLRALPGGLIHQSFTAEPVGPGEPFFLQRINTHVFHDATQLIANYLQLTAHVQEQGMTMNMPAPLRFRNGQFLFEDRQGDVWRLFSLISPSFSKDTPANPGEAAAVASEFARFLAVFSTLSPARLVPALPGFHDLAARYAAFSQAQRHAYRQRLQEAGTLATALEDRQRYVALFRELTKDGIPLRVMHHDAKISNVLFGEGGTIYGIVDYDTAMPGYIFSDLGDLIRSMAATAGESDTRREAEIRKSYYEAIVGAYLGTVGPMLTATEKEYIHFSGIMMTYMQALRFMSDYLTGDAYYRVSYPSQNLDRARNQVRLLESLETFLADNYGFSV